MQLKVLANDPSWIALKSRCDALLPLGVRWPNLSGDTSSVLVPGSGPVGSYYIDAGYAGEGYHAAIGELSLCYRMSAETDPSSAAAYLNKAKFVVMAMSEPPATVTRNSDGLQFSAYLTITAAGQALNFTSYANSLAVGDAVTLEGFTGCEAANGQWKIDTKTATSFTIRKVDDSPAPLSDAACTNRSFNNLKDGGFATRFYGPALATAYDWFYDGLSAQEKARVMTSMHRLVKEYKRQGNNLSHPENNYYAGYFWALVATYVASKNEPGADEAWLEAEIDYQFAGANRLRDYQNRWAAGGGFGEGWQAYGYNASRAILNAQLAMKLAFGVDWTQAPHQFTFLADNLKYWIHFNTPNRMSLDENEYTYRIGYPESAWVPLSHAVFMAHAARKFNISFAPYFQGWYKDVHAKQKLAAGGLVPPWNPPGAYTSAPVARDDFAYGDSEAPSADYKELPLSYQGLSGNYAEARGDWSENAVQLYFVGGPSIGSAGNGKTQFNSGSLAIQRGGDRLLVFGLGESARSYDLLTSEQHNALHNERGTYINRKNSIFYADRPGGTKGVQGLPALTQIPGHNNAVLTHPTKIDAADDGLSYAYFRSINLHHTYNPSAVDSQTHATGWTREVLFLRPKSIVVFDRTSVRNADDDRAMFWTFGRTPIEVATPDGTMKRYEISRGAVFKGAMTSVLPVGKSVSVVNHSNPGISAGAPLNFLFRIEVRPDALDHQNDRWLTILDAAASAAELESVTRLSSVNADAVQLSASGIAAFATAQGASVSYTIGHGAAGTLNHFVTGLAANSSYQVTIDGAGVVTIAAGAGLPSTAAGVLAFKSVNGVPSALATR